MCALSGRPRNTMGKMNNLGTRLNNWLNVRWSKDNNWNGQTGQEDGFCQFDTVGNGLRAGRIILQHYLTQGFDTPEKIIMRYAPSFENETEKYIADICLWTGYDRHEKMTLMDITNLMCAMVRQETGNRCTDALLVEAMK